MYTEHKVPMRGGVNLNYREYNPQGQGHPVLCFSGLTRNAHDYHFLAEHLAARGRRVIALDYRGRGKSDFDPNWKNYRPIRLLADVVSFTRRLQLKHAVVIGTSLGGLLTMGLAAIRHGFLMGAVINDIGPDLTAKGIPRICAYVGQDHPEPDWDAAVVHLKHNFPTLGLTSEEEWRFIAEGSFAPGADGKLHIAWDANIARTLANGAKSPVPLWLVYRALANVPTLAIRGGNSDVLSETTFDHMARLKPDLIRLTVPGAGHTPTLNEPECRAAIDALLDRVG
jgi:pimeloyl-ACP methyl ester carboxylesterase